MNKPLIRKWVKALRSGRYKQTQNRLVDRDDNNKLGYCCLGVLCRVAGKNPSSDKNDGGGILRLSLMRELNLKMIDQKQLALINDKTVNDKQERRIVKNNFTKIAEFIERKYLS